MEENQNLSHPIQPEPASTSPSAQKSRKKFFIIIGIIVLFLMASSASAAYLLLGNSQNDQVACTLDAKICPDGSAVGRVAPSCEFAPCPTPTVTSDPSTIILYTNKKHGFTLNYPDSWTLRESNTRVDLDKDDSLLTFYFHDDPDAQYSNFPPTLKQEAMQIGSESAVFNFYTTTVTEQFAAYSDTRALKLIGKNVSTVNIYLNGESQESDLSSIKQILSTFRFVDVPTVQDWKMYVNKKANYTIKYPAEFFTNCPTAEDVFNLRYERNYDCYAGVDGPSVIGISTTPNWHTENANQSNFKCYSVKSEKTTLDGVSGFKYKRYELDNEGCVSSKSHKSDYEEYIIVYKNDIPYTITYEHGIDDEIKNQILSTFKFTN